MNYWNTAGGIQSILERLETAFMLNVWSVLLSLFEAVSVKLQRVDTSLPNILDLGQFLINLVAGIRDDFDLYEERMLE